jgi:hypothetical protein
MNPNNHRIKRMTKMVHNIPLSSFQSRKLVPALAAMIELLGKQR